MLDQTDLFGTAPRLPEGFKYEPDVISAAAEAGLVESFTDLPFKEFEFHGYLGKRRVVSFGWRYDYTARKIERSSDIPDFLLETRESAAAFAGVRSQDLQQALVTEYSAGAGIGWHRDKPEFGQIVGISLVSPCVFRLRRKAGTSWERISIEAAPRSAYLMSGSSRSEWEHSIPPVDQLRYSITFRNLRQPASGS